MTSNKVPEKQVDAETENAKPKHVEQVDDKSHGTTEDVVRLERQDSNTTENLDNLVYDNEEEEPELHMRTYLALASIYLLLVGQGLAFQGPPSVLPYIGADLGDNVQQAWIPNALILVQAVLGPVICSASDVFQARKPILVGSCLLSLVGSAIAPGATNINRVIGAQCLLGVGLAAVPLSYVVPSEILPRKWRPMAQASTGIVAALMAVVGPLSIGALIKRDSHNGWRQYYWIEFAFWAAAAIGILLGYRPPKRHTRLDHLSLWQKLGHLDIPGCFLLTIGLTLFTFGLSVGGGVYPWASARTLATLVVGFVFLVFFGVYEWKWTTTGVLDHELFRGGKDRGRTFAICNALIFIEGVLGMGFIVFYGVVSNFLFTQDPFMTAVRVLAFNGFFLLSCPFWGLVSTKLRIVREPLLAGFVFLTAGTLGMATLQPGQNANQLIFGAIGGFGFGSLLILIVTAVQLSTPHSHIATATALTNSSRSVGGLILTAGMSTALSNGLISKVPSYVAKAAVTAGLASSSIEAFVGALTGNDPSALARIPGITPEITAKGLAALQHAYADSLRVIYIMAAPFGVVAIIACLFLGDMKKTMTYRVDAPMEDLHARHHHD
ncbi:uncharacterized protein Z519_04158 [Cladophialophora bantiana CBS 173.52]|uniref:Major facilitator superfamily (MFS) profile domain-containing protein n=1 Tax=Cladophialophora bantiana (strain ATCC 10958 / CBS 173.52 / CDC B-1940 / NIH 8579) TaxID=1442370 RepID=A0A0D2HQ68_CLAB1|nr:uncharacterized protein Z519_04158 [Cladophialophora bantiana CBS 173.52]KIW95573.1 hypothetical protein Z519_04158 [Cladophialophora bantiana CBS 173.52]